MPRAKDGQEPYEWEEQADFVDWLKAKGIRHYAVNNGVSCSIQQARKMKRMGLNAGVPDICLPIPNTRYHGLYLELKRRKKGHVSESQREWLEYLKSVGYAAGVVRGFDHAKQCVLAYLAIPI